jgi:hypothetical protein
MPKRSVDHFIQAIALALTSATLGLAQQPSTHGPLNLVAPNGIGRIIIPAPANDIQWSGFNLYDQGALPVFETRNPSANLIVSYVLFPNQTHSGTPNICRDDIVSAGTRSISPTPGIADIKHVTRTDHAPIKGQPIASGSYFVESLAGADVKQQNMFIVAASATLCAEMHISKTAFQPTDEPQFAAQAETFTFDPDYTPTAQDYFTLGSIFFRVTKSYESAAAYYQRSLDLLPSNTDLKLRRVVTDQLAMSYGISGQIKQSRAVNEAAIKTDPDYPLYYYNLACADAEQGNASDAKLHLQQAFDRKANVVSGEKLPDPTQDDSILKLKKNKEFWAFVQTLK